MRDLARVPDSIALIESFYGAGKFVAFVCHAPGVLRHVTYKGAPLVKGKRVTGFTNGEEEDVQLTHIVPFLVENELLRLGAIFEKVRNWEPFCIVDGHLITGQNPASSTVTAQTLLKQLKAEMVPAHRCSTPGGSMSTIAEIPETIRLAPTEGGASANTRLLRRYLRVRGFSKKICETLNPEDCVIQTMPEASPTKWHLAHTTWFFEVFLLKQFLPDYQTLHPQYGFLLIPTTTPSVPLLFAAPPGFIVTADAQRGLSLSV